MDAPDDLVDGEPPTIDPYEVMGVERTATADQVKSAYRKLALKNHPDKVSEDQQQKAHETFQSIAFAYAILSDPTRRKRYDETGSTSDSIVDSDGFSWSDFYREQFQNAISNDAIEKFAVQYKGSDEERDDILIAYEEHEGNMDAIYESVMLSDVLKDDERFRRIIGDAIASRDVPAFKAYTKESKKSRNARAKAAKGEAAEAEEYAKELGIHDKLFGNKKGKKKECSENELGALIRRNMQGRGDFLDNLAAKYNTAPLAGKKGKKRRAEESEPSEEAFQAAAARLKRGKNGVRYASSTLQLWNAVLALKVSRKHNRRIFKRESERLTWYPSYTEISIFFSLNHPIRWVCITGVVVAIDDYYGTRVYTVDDSTGQCIECSVAIPKVVTDRSNCRDNGQGKDEGHAAAMKNANNQQTDPTNAVPTAPPPPDIDVGMVVEVKGSVKLFRNQIQIKIRNVTRILSTSQEVLFWDKTRDFRRDVLSQPWMLKDREVRRCRKLQQVEAADLEEKKGGKKHTKKESEGAGERTASGSGSTHESEGRLRTKDSLVGNSVKVAKAQRAARTESLRARLSDGNKYNALGL